MEPISRKKFLRGAASAFGIAALGSLNAFGAETLPESTTETASWRAKPAAVAEDSFAEMIDTDVLVIGCGNSGIMAAYGAAEKGVRVAVLEKTAMPGISRSYIGALNSSAMQAANISVDPCEAASLLARYASHNCDFDLLLTWAKCSGLAIDWLSNMIEKLSGFKQHLMSDIGEYALGKAEALYGTYPMHHVLQSEETTSRTWVSELAGVAEENGIDIYYETVMEQLIQSEDGRITGAVAKDDEGRYLKFNAVKGVILCTGGYSANNEMMLDLQPEAVAVCGNNQSGNTDGSGIRAGLWAGADMDTRPTSMYFDRAAMIPSSCTSYMDPAWSGSAYLVMGSQPFLHVNVDGKRFCNESLPYDFRVNAASLQKDKRWITVWDANWKEDVERFNTIGCSRIAKPESGLAYTSAEMVEDMHAMLIEGGRLQKADTLEELAALLCIPADQFITTVERYNTLADLGVDEDYGKPAYRLSHINTPPYYGAVVMGNLLCTLDGLRINTRMQVLDKAGAPVPGLYAAGNDSGGLFADNYPELLVGVAVGRSITFGRLAGQYAAEL